MSEAIGVRIDEEFLKKIDKISKDEVLDRSNTIRKLMYLGYKDFIMMKAAEDYLKGKVTMTEAASSAEVTVWEMELHLVEKQGYKSSYSIQDLDDELKLIK